MQRQSLVINEICSTVNIHCENWHMIPEAQFYAATLKAAARCRTQLAAKIKGNQINCLHGNQISMDHLINDILDHENM